MIRGVLDPGHYGKYNKGILLGYYESEFNLKFCKLLKEELESTGQFEIILTRYGTKDISLTHRGQMAKGKDFFLSVHTDSAGNSTGSLVIDSVDLETEAFAKSLTDACGRGFGLPSKPVREREYKNSGEDYYTVIDTAQDIGCPLVHLLECGNHSNKIDCTKLMDGELIKKAVKEIAMAYISYFKVQIEPVSEVSDWAVKGQAYCMNKGISDGTKPKDLVTREEVWTMIERAFNNG